MKQITDKVWVVVPAAGKSRRMESTLPKQYLPLLGRPLIELTLNRLLELNPVEQIVVAINQDDITFSTLAISSHNKISSVIGGQERSDSVLSALLSLELTATDSDWVLVHDAARCCVRPDIIKKLISELSDDSIGGILAVPVSDTLKKVSPQKTIESTVDRSTIWQAQTPQFFRYGLLKKSLELAIEQDAIITDEASALEFAGYNVKVCMGHYDNIKVTHKEDIALAELYLQNQALTKVEVN